MYYTGIDWADQKYDLVILNDNGTYVYPIFEIDKSDEGFNELLGKLRKLSPNPDDFKIGIETPQNLLVDSLLMWGYPVFSIHPSSMKSFRRRYRPTNARDDKYDAYVLADVVRTDEACWKKVERGSKLTHYITMLVLDHYHLIQKYTAAHNTFKQTLKEYYPEYIHFFKDVSCPASLQFLTSYPSFDAAKQLDQQQLINFFKEQHLFNQKRVSNIYRILQHSHIDVPQAIISSKTLTALAYTKQLTVLNSCLDEYEQQIKTAIAKHPDTELFMSFPAVAEITAARLIALFGDNRRLYHDASLIQTKAGTCPVTEITGYDKKRNQCHKIIYFRQGCHKIYRSFVHRMAFSSLTQSQWCRDYYDNHRQMGHDHHHSLRCLANVLLKILFAMWKNNTMYDENIFLAQKTKHIINTKKKAA